MTNDSEVPAEPTFAVPGVLCVSPLASDRSVLYVGPAAGWMIPRGIARWEREISFVARKDMTSELARTLRAVLPYEQIAPKKLPVTCKAVATSPFLPLRSKLLEKTKEHVRVHTVGVDRVTAGFYYLAEGFGERVHVQGNLVEMLAPSLEPTSSNAEIESLREGLIDRLLMKFSSGVVSELAVELADALPRMSADGRGLVGTHLEVFEVQGRSLISRAARLELRARELIRALEIAEREGRERATIPLYGEAVQELLPPLEVRIGADTIELPVCKRWIVRGALDERAMVPSPTPAPARVRAPRPSDLPSPMETSAPELASVSKREDERESLPPEPNEFEGRRSHVVMRAFAVLFAMAAIAHAVWRTVLAK